jgi:exosortase A-associated hydrolase 1
MSESACTFRCDSSGATLLGIAHTPSSASCRVGVVVVVGGPQFRVGSHRQFVLLARALAAEGIPVFRFDYTGMGDSDGPPTSFENIDDDIGAAIDCLQAKVPGIEDIVLWGLCDAASACLMYAPRDARVKGLVLLNPWVRTQASEAQAYLQGYYGQRLFSSEYWRKVARKPATLLDSARSLFGDVLKSSRTESTTLSRTRQSTHFIDRMLSGAERFRGEILVILSGRDYTADEFRLVLKRSPAWAAALSRRGVKTSELPEANHTFARSDWRRTVELLTRDLVRRVAGMLP